jgi:hypothetical protein
VDAGQDLKSKFGDVVFIHESKGKYKKNNGESKAAMGIILGRLWKGGGAFKVLKLSTGRIIYKRKVIKIKVTDEIKKVLEGSYEVDEDEDEEEGVVG